MEMEQRKFKGYWWLPSGPEEQIAGTLTIDSRGNVKLELYGCFGPADDYVILDRKDDSAIFGRCYTPDSKMTDVSLIGCSSTLTLYVNDNTFPLTRYTCRYALIGIHCQKMEDAMFFKAHVDFKELAFWCPPKNVTFTMREDSISVSIETKIDEKAPLVSVELDGGLKIQLKEGATYKPDYPKLYIDQSTYLEILKDDMDALLALSTSRMFERFMSVATLAPVEHGRIMLYSKRKCQKFEGGKVIYHPIELVTYLYLDDVQETYKQHDFLFQFTDVAQELGLMLDKLNTDKSIAQIWSNLVDSLEKKRVFTSNDFLVLIQAIDGFVIRYRKDQKLLPKLQTLREEFKDIKKLKLTDEDLEAAKGSRNYYSHILKLEEKEDKHALEGWELFDLTKKLRVLLICCVLNFMGMDNDKINQLLNKSNNSLLKC
jgi:hypothetical protein